MASLYRCLRHTLWKPYKPILHTSYLRVVLRKSLIRLARFSRGPYMSHNLNSFFGSDIRDYIADY